MAAQAGGACGDAPADDRSADSANHVIGERRRGELGGSETGGWRR
jgi:hypothetical protein